MSKHFLKSPEAKTICMIKLSTEQPSCWVDFKYMYIGSMYFLSEWMWILLQVGLQKEMLTFSEICVADETLAFMISRSCHAALH